MTYEQNDVRAHEANALAYLAVELKEELEFLNILYNITHLSYNVLANTKFSESSKLTRALVLLVGRMSDYLRSIKLLIEKGYPEQAGTLAASVFEIAHTCVYFTHNDEALDRWIRAGQTDEIQKVLGNRWPQVVKQNCNTNLLKIYSPEKEYQFYKQLCGMKHALPVRIDFAHDPEGKTMMLDLCPKTHNTAIKDSRLVTIAVSHEVEIAILTLCLHLNHPDLNDFLLTIQDIKDRLDTKYQQIYRPLEVVE